jgi:hypothetical protein
LKVCIETGVTHIEGLDLNDLFFFLIITKEQSRTVITVCWWQERFEAEMNIVRDSWNNWHRREQAVKH